MKRNYLTPTVELEELVVEQGIAVSDGAMMDISDWEKGETGWFEE